MVTRIGIINALSRRLKEEFVRSVSSLPHFDLNKVSPKLTFTFTSQSGRPAVGGHNTIPLYYYYIVRVN